MGFSDLQSHIVQEIPAAVQPVDLLKIVSERKGIYKLAIDGECCLDRLYGGFYPDWVCGGQWNKMEQFLISFANTIHSSPIELVIFLNGSLEPERMTNEWCKSQEKYYKYLQEIQKHVATKRKPPPKVWWIPPAFLRSAIRLACRSFHLQLVCSLDDHHKDLLRSVKNGSFDGVLVDDAEYFVFDNPSPSYFSAQKLKLTFKGTLDTTEVKLDKVYKSLDLSKERFHVFAALIGNHILSGEDLKTFYISLGVKNVELKVTVFEKVAEFARSLESLEHDKIADLIISVTNSTDETARLVFRNKILKCLNYYTAITSAVKSRNSAGSKQKPEANTKKASKSKSESTILDDVSTLSTLPSDNDRLENGKHVFNEIGAGDCSEVGAAATHFQKQTILNTTQATVQVPVENETKEFFLSDKKVYRVHHSIVNIATNRHKNGAMSPYICQIIKNKEIKLSLIIEDIKNMSELPRAYELFRPLRQRVYGILFNLHHKHFIAKKNSEQDPIIFVKESRYDPLTKSVKTVGVPACLVGWAVPTVETLWLAEGDEAKRKRIRTFLTCLKSENQMILDQSVVPPHLFVLCCVLRYIVSSDKVLRRNELDAFIAQALILELTDPNVAQEIEITKLTTRGVHLSHLFMEGVEMTLLANDACGAPVPFSSFEPWKFFNGKIFNFVLEQLSAGKGWPEICGFKMNLVFVMNKLRMAILDGVKPQHFAPSVVNPLVQMGSRGFNNMPGLMGSGQFATSLFEDRPFTSSVGAGTFRGRGFSGNSQYFNDPNSSYGGFPLQLGARYNSGFMPDGIGRQRRGQHGGQLQIAGTVVGSWGANGSYEANSFMNSSLVLRNPTHSLGGVRREHQVPSLLDQVRISPGSRVPHNRQSSTGHQWNQRKTRSVSAKFQKKSIMKKSSECSVGSGLRPICEADAEQVDTLTNTATASTTTKSKFVSFKDEGSHNHVREEDGSGDAKIFEEKYGINDATAQMSTLGMDVDSSRMSQCRASI